MIVRNFVNTPVDQRNPKNTDSFLLNATLQIINTQVRIWGWLTVEEIDVITHWTNLET